MAAVCFGDHSTDRVDHMKHLINQMPFKIAPLETSVKNDLTTYLRIFGHRNSAIMTFLNKHVQFEQDRYNLSHPPLLKYGREDLAYLAVARRLVRICIFK